MKSTGAARRQGWMKRAGLAALLGSVLALGGCDAFGIDDEVRAINAINEQLIKELNEADDDKDKEAAWKKHKGELEEAYAALDKAKDGVLKIGMDGDTNKQYNESRGSLDYLMSKLGDKSYKQYQKIVNRD